MKVTEQFARTSVRAHYLMQLGSYISELTDISGARLAYTNKYPNIWYNSAYDIQVDPSAVDDLIPKIETHMARRDRIPSIYVSPATSPSNLSELLEDRGYGKVETEAWMFADLSKLPKPHTQPSEVSVWEAQTDADLQVFADLYRKGFPSPTVDLQIQAYIDGFKSKLPLVESTCFILNYCNQPAGMYISLRLGEYSGLYSGTVAKEYRTTNVFQVMVNHSKIMAAQRGIKYQFLQTIAGTSLEIAFRRFGYVTKFSRTCYSPRSAINSTLSQ